MNEDPLDRPGSDADMSSSEGPKAPNERKGAKRNRISGPVRRALEDLCFTLWNASSDPVVQRALLNWKARNL